MLRARLTILTINGVCPSCVHAGAQTIAAGDWHSMLLKQDGTVWTAGANNHGQLGDGTNTARKNFVQVNGVTGQLASRTQNGQPTIRSRVHLMRVT